MTYGVYIVEDHPLLARVLGDLIAQEPEFEVRGTSPSAEDALDALAGIDVQLALVDVSLKHMNGVEFVERLRAMDLRVPVLIMSGHEEALYAERALRAGARGYLMKADAVGCLHDAMRCVLNGEVFVSERMRAQLPAALLDSRSRDAA
ncbi:MAG TPA: response regulator transcription factor [Rubricoccaceae bacterium]|nr:response regulator transcription factor [Rubricoccaceae bacterium]